MEGAQYLHHRIIDGTYQAILYWKVSDGIMYILEPDGWKPTKVPVKFIEDIDPSHIKFRIGGKPNDQP